MEISVLELLGLDKFIHEPLNATTLCAMNQQIVMAISEFENEGKLHISTSFKGISLEDPLNIEILGCIPFMDPDLFKRFSGPWSIIYNQKHIGSAFYGSQLQPSLTENNVKLGWNVRFIPAKVETDAFEYTSKMLDIKYQEPTPFSTLFRLNHMMKTEEIEVPKPDHLMLDVITLIGSHRFYKEFKILETIGSLNGQVILMPQIFSFDDEAIKKLTEAEHERLDKIHQWKMTIADYVLVVNPGGYIGKDTQDEIDWCKEHGIELKYLGEVMIENPVVAEYINRYT